MDMKPFSIVIDVFVY